MSRLQAVGLCVVLLFSGACTQRWTFAPPGRFSRTPNDSPPPVADYQTRHPEHPAAKFEEAVPLRGPSRRSDQVVAVGLLRPAPVDHGVTRLPEVSEVVPAGMNWLEPSLAAVSDPAIEFSDDAGHCCSCRRSLDNLRWRLRRESQQAKHHIYSDHRHYYSWLTARDLLIGVGASSILANTALDENFQDWYQDDVRSRGLDDFSSFWKTVGEGDIFIPAFAGLSVVGTMLERYPVFEAAGDFGDRTTRGYLLGAPPMLFMQYCLGGSRPGETGHGSEWRSFDDSNGVSGHAFVGAVPLITAAKMCERPYMKGCFYFFSTLPAWSRINDDAHYLSQAFLGWWMAYLACRAVDQTHYEQQQLTFSPVVTPGLLGMTAIYRR